MPYQIQLISYWMTQTHHLVYMCSITVVFDMMFLQRTWNFCWVEGDVHWQVRNEFCWIANNVLSNLCQSLNKGLTTQVYIPITQHFRYSNDIICFRVLWRSSVCGSKESWGLQPSAEDTSNVSHTIVHEDEVSIMCAIIIIIAPFMQTHSTIFSETRVNEMQNFTMNCSLRGNKLNCDVAEGCAPAMDKSNYCTINNDTSTRKEC